MNKKIIVIDGYLAAGKSTFAVSLSKAINVPYFSKDTFKIALCSSVNISNRNEGSRFSVVAFDAMMYVAERLLETGCPFIIEGNFVPAGIKKTDEAGVIRALIDKYGYQALTFMFTGDTRVFYERYIEREKSPERGDANRDFEEIPYKQFYDYCLSLDAFNVGGDVVKIDTTDFEKVDFDNYIKTAYRFIKDC